MLASSNASGESLSVTSEPLKFEGMLIQKMVYSWIKAMLVVFAMAICLLMVACSGNRGRQLPLQGFEDLKAKKETNQLSGGSFQREEDVLAVSLETQWIVNAIAAKQLIEQGATLLDARGGLSWQRLRGAIALRWDDFSQKGATHRGKLLEKDELLTQRLQGLGISANVPVVVFGNPPNDWGEAGRIVWMLRTLGHHQAVLVDGGLSALLTAGVPLQQGRQTAPAAGDFVVQRNSIWTIQQGELKDRLHQDRLQAENFIVIDTREPREYAGQTPYGEQRGGHIPGAIHLYFKELSQENGQLLPPQALQKKLSDAGITSESDIVVYCTGGVRSGWLVSVLVNMGFSAKNYAGSMWEWSAAPAEDYPLEAQ